MEKREDRQEYRGIWFHPEVNPYVRAVLSTTFDNRERVRIVYGDVATGEAWGDEEDAKKFDVRAYGAVGYIGKSTGPIKIPLEICNSRSIGGGAILDHCIVYIETTKGKRVLYKHPEFHWGKGIK